MSCGYKQNTMSQQDYFRKGMHVFLPKNNFFIQMNFETFFFQFVIINAYTCPST
jgi:hypothetical protein